MPKTPPRILTILIACSWLSATELIDRVLTRIAKWDDPVLGIARICDASLRQQGARLDAAAGADPDLIKRFPLFGIPFAVKDNIEVAGPADHGRCPAFVYTPSETAPVVQQLVSAGAPQRLE
jgi:allophanate hydrolase